VEYNPCARNPKTLILKNLAKGGLIKFNPPSASFCCCTSSPTSRFALLSESLFVVRHIPVPDRFAASAPIRSRRIGVCTKKSNQKKVHPAPAPLRGSLRCSHRAAQTETRGCAAQTAVCFFPLGTEPNSIANGPRPRGLGANPNCHVILRDYF
jgi:hypothetical protein